MTEVETFSFKELKSMAVIPEQLKVILCKLTLEELQK